MPRAPDVDMDQAPSREGDKEYAQSRAGRRLLLRAWKPGSQRWVYTTLGKRFFARRYNEWVIEIPVVIHTKEGRRRKTRIPYEWLNPIARRVRTSIFDDVNDAARERLKMSILDEVMKRQDDDDEYEHERTNVHEHLYSLASKDTQCNLNISTIYYNNFVLVLCYY